MQASVKVWEQQQRRAVPQPAPIVAAPLAAHIPWGCVAVILEAYRLHATVRRKTGSSISLSHAIA